MRKQSEAKKLRIVLEIDDQATVEAYHACDKELILADIVEGSLVSKCSIVSVETVGIKYGCFVDSELEIYDDCVIGNVNCDFCGYASGIKSKEQCQYWRVVEG